MAFAEGLQVLDKLGLPHYLLSEDIVGESGDIINTADLFPFHPLGGLKGIEEGFQGKTLFSFPYTPPFLPRNSYEKRIFVTPREEHRNLGITFLIGSLMIYQHIRRNCGRPILIGDLNTIPYGSVGQLSPDDEVERRIAENIYIMTAEKYEGISLL